MEDVGAPATSAVAFQHSVLQNSEVLLPPPPPLPVEVAKKECIYENLIDIQKRKEKERSAEGGAKRSVFIVRHGERIDFAFGSWVPFCFDESGKYIQQDLNMPKTLPERTGGALAYRKDTPLTNIGLYEALLVGQALRENNVSIDHVYSSPAFRCIQTCDSMLTGYNKRKELPIKVEPGLFEWMAWYPPENVPNWMTASELKNAGFYIDESHVPFISEKDVKENKENCEQFYLRSAFITRCALAAYPTGNILLVGHTSTVDTCSRELIGKEPRTAGEMTKVIQKIPYCSVVQVTGKGSNWEIVEPPCLPLTHTTNQRFDWKVLL